MPLITSSCPLCQKPSTSAHFPFCSKACAYRDLGVWLKGEYQIPGEPLSEELTVAPSFEEESDEDHENP